MKGRLAKERGKGEKDEAAKDPREGERQAWTEMDEGEV